MARRRWRPEPRAGRGVERRMEELTKDDEGGVPLCVGDWGQS